MRHIPDAHMGNVGIDASYRHPLEYAVPRYVDSMSRDRVFHTGLFHCCSPILGWSGMRQKWGKCNPGPDTGRDDSTLLDRTSRADADKRRKEAIIGPWLIRPSLQRWSARFSPFSYPFFDGRPIIAGITYCGLLCSVVSANMITTAFAVGFLDLDQSYQMLTALLSSFLRQPEFLKLLTFLQHVLLSVLTNRLLFRLREYNRSLVRSVQGPSSILLPEGTIAFAQSRHAIEIEMPRLSDGKEAEEPPHEFGAV
ncbi:hypothetical protein HWV62_21144 [Athelia sp. TMB]|nr:hypothetical protein HWV62_21144 [Athelia sp. TMB]